MFENEVYQKGVIDMPDPRDYKGEHILGDIPKDFKYPESVRMDTNEGNQGALTETKMACTCFSAYHAAKIANELEHGNELFPDYLQGWRNQKEYGTGSDTKGDFVQTALKQIVKKGFVMVNGEVFPISGYVNILHAEVKYYLAQKMAVVTSADVTSTNFKNAKKTGYFTGKDGDRIGGHAFVLEGYETNKKGEIEYIAGNSYGSTYGYFKDGTFKIHEKYMNSQNLGSCYVLHDVKDVSYLFKDLTDESWAYEACKYLKENGLIKGYDDGSFRPNQALTRAEGAQLMYNIIKFLKK